MKFAMRLALILCLMLTGIGLGVARGTVQIDGQIVLCTGEGVIVRNIPGAPAQGKTRAHICPDMALALLSAAVPAEATIIRHATLRHFVPQPVVVALASRRPPAASARDPPEYVFT